MSSVSVKRTTSILFVLRLLRMLMSLFTVALTAKYFGVSVEKDAWLLVSTLLSATTMMVWGPINETFRAKFIFIRERDSEDKAVRAAVALFCGVVVITSVIILVLALLHGPIARFSASDLSRDGIYWFGSLFLTLLPTLLIEEINNISSSILNAYNIFYLPELVATFTGIGYIAILMFLAPTVGIYALVAGQYMSTVSLTVVLFAALARKKIFSRAQLTSPDFRLLRPFVIYALPFFFPYAIGQLNAFGERWLAGLLGVGNISILDFGRKFTVILQTVIGSILTTMMVPLLARAHSAGDNVDFAAKLNEHLSVIYGIMLLAVPLLFGGAYPLCDFLYHRGTVTAENIAEITMLCRLYAAAFLGVMVYVIFGNILLSTERGKLYAFWGVLAQIAVLGLNLGLVSTLGLIIFPLSLGTVHLLTGIVMWAKGRVRDSDTVRRMLKFNLTVIFSSAVTYFVCGFLRFVNPFMSLAAVSFVVVILAIFLSPFVDINPWTILRRIRK